jgi:hypothetical protein
VGACNVKVQSDVKKTGHGSHNGTFQCNYYKICLHSKIRNSHLSHVQRSTYLIHIA